MSDQGQDLGGAWVASRFPDGGNEHFRQSALDAGDIVWLQGMERPTEYFVDAILSLRRHMLNLGAKPEHPACKELDNLAAKYSAINTANRRELAALIKERDKT